MRKAFRHSPQRMVKCVMAQEKLLPDVAPQWGQVIVIVSVSAIGTALLLHLLIHHGSFNVMDLYPTLPVPHPYLLYFFSEAKSKFLRTHDTQRAQWRYTKSPLRPGTPA